MNKYTRHSFRKIAQEDIPAIEHAAQNRHIAIKASSRFDTYFRCVKLLSESSEKAKSRYGIETIVTALKEIAELYGIIMTFIDDNSEVYTQKLTVILAGANIPNESERDTHARNTAFELNMAAHFKKAEFPTVLCEPDIKVNINNSDVFIACKRPASISNFEKTIKDSKRQIIKRGKGIIALSLDKLMNPSFNILQGRSTTSIAETVIDEINSFRDRYKSIIGRASDNRKIFGLVFSFGLVASDLAEGIFVTYQQIVTTNLCSLNSPNILLLKEMENCFVPISF